MTQSDSIAGRERTTAPPLSEQAVDCYVHGICHLVSELGVNEGLEKAAVILTHALDVSEAGGIVREDAFAPAALGPGV